MHIGNVYTRSLDALQDADDGNGKQRDGYREKQRDP
jgi:hypothetical protein